MTVERQVRLRPHGLPVALGALADCFTASVFSMRKPCYTRLQEWLYSLVIECATRRRGATYNAFARVVGLSGVVESSVASGRVSLVGVTVGG